MMSLEEYLAIPFILAVESFEGSDGDWLRRASFPELPGCVVEGYSAVEIIEKLDELRVRRIVEMMDKGEDIPVPRPPLKSAIPALNKEQLEFARWLVSHGRLSDQQ
ncbi:MAG: hypothetical protein EXR51_02620 [Dehalococcoidia bacterium]|nr:hypothetical protein [Dehalococcoidia bacterium]